MENESLDIFNSVLILASPETALDTDYASILGVIGHEYFHNWTGNRVIWVAQVQNLQTPAGIHLLALVQILGVIMSIHSPLILNQQKHMKLRVPLKAMVVGPLIRKNGKSKNLQK